MSTHRDASRPTGLSDVGAHPAHPPCDLYVPGHLPHYIQARKAWDSGEPVFWGRYAGIDDGRLVVRYLDRTARYWIHRPAEVLSRAREGDKVRVSERYRFADIQRRFEHVLAVCIALPEDPIRPCDVAADDASLDDLVTRLTERGGFVVSGSELTRLVGTEPEDREGDPPDLVS